MASAKEEKPGEVGKDNEKVGSVCGCMYILYILLFLIYIYINIYIFTHIFGASWRIIDDIYYII